MHLLRCACVSAVALAAVVHAPGRAEASPELRLGLTSDPDTVFLGFGFQNPISSMSSGFIAITPKIDFGIGEDADFFSVRGSADFEFMFALGGRGTYVYPLVGLSLYYYNFDDCVGSACDGTEVGLNAGFGVKFNRFAIEVVAGIQDLPDVTFAFGILF